MRKKGQLLRTTVYPGHAKLLLYEINFHFAFREIKKISFRIHPSTYFGFTSSLRFRNRFRSSATELEKRKQMSLTPISTVPLGFFVRKINLNQDDTKHTN
jgi:hypothetical protein